jgi:hypothetical protein
MMCQPDDVGLEYLEPFCYSTQPNWLTELGIKEMLEKSAMAGDIAFVAGLGRNTQSVPAEQQPAYLAAQCWGHDVIGRVMIAMKILQETHGAHLAWPQLNAARISETLRPNLETQVPHGVNVFASGHALRPPGGDEVITQRLKCCAKMRLEETSVAQLLGASYMVDLATSDCFSRKKLNNFITYANPHVNYDIAPHLHVASVDLQQ